MLENKHLKTHPDVIAALPTKKTDKDPCRWNVICKKDKFNKAKQLVMEAIVNFNELMPKDMRTNKDLIPAVPQKNGGSAHSESDEMADDNGCDTRQQATLDSCGSMMPEEDQCHFQPVPEMASTAGFSKKSLTHLWQCLQ